MEKWAKVNEDTRADVIIKWSRERDKITITVNDKRLAWGIEEEVRLRPEKYSSMAEFVRVALTKEINSNKKYQI